MNLTNKQQNKNKLKGGWLFLGVMLLVYAATALVDFSLAYQSLLFFVSVFIQIVPILVLVFIFMVLINFILTPKQVRNYLGETSGLKGWLVAIVGGIFSTGPIYTWYILLAELKQQGMKTSLMAVFLYCRAVKLPLLPLLVHYFGIQYTLILSLYLICFSVLGGIVTGLLAGDTDSTN